MSYVEPSPDVQEITAEASNQNILFAGDRGELQLDTRRTLVQLLSGPSLDERRHSHLWQVLLRDEDVIRKRLSELFLELVVDRDLQVAFTRQFEVEELDAPRLLRRAQLTFIESTLLLHLRQELTQAQARGERAVLASGEIHEFLSLYQRTGSTDHAVFTKRIGAAIEKMKTHNIIQKVRGSEDRFEVSPTLKILFSAEEIQALTLLYRQMAAGASPPLPPQSDTEGEGA